MHRRFIPMNVLCLALLFLGSEPGCAQSSVRVDSFFVSSLGRTKSITLLLPESYNPQVLYPVLYLLHGYSGDHTDWMKLTKLAVYAGRLPLIIVMPDAENSWYVNSATVEQDRFEDYVVHDLHRFIRQRYPIDTMKQGIAGLSMGGYGAIMLAMKHPTRFQFAGSLSGA
ncbi:MAG: alpha/beta hydrolase-fold protein, partial [Bacteroidota bacterium]